MKKIFIVALFVLSMCNATAFGMTQEIILTKLYVIMPFDDLDDDRVAQRPDPTQFHASIEGNQLTVDIDGYAYLEVVDHETGEMVIEEEIGGETTLDIPQGGNYELYIYTESGAVMHGEFSVDESK